MKLIESIKKYFSVEEKNEEKITDEALSRSLTASFLGIFVCLAVLVGLTWAWYTDSLSTKTTHFQAANFDLTISVGSAAGDVTPDADGKYTLDPNVEYTVAFITKGTVSASKGFCRIGVTRQGETAESVYFTNVFAKETAYKFNIKGAAGITVSPMWGKLPDTVGDDYKIENDKNLVIPKLVTSPAPAPAPAANAEETTAADTTEAPAETTADTTAETTAETTAAEG